MSKRKKTTDDSAKKKNCKKTCKANPDIVGLKGDNLPALGLPSYPTVRRSTRKSSSQYARRSDEVAEKNSCLRLQKTKPASRTDHKKPEKLLSNNVNINNKSLRKEKRKLTARDSKPVTSSSDNTMDISITRSSSSSRTLKKNKRQITQSKSRKSDCTSAAPESLTIPQFNFQEDLPESDVISLSDSKPVERDKKSIRKNADVSQLTTSGCSLKKHIQVQSKGLNLPDINGFSCNQSLESSEPDFGQEKQTCFAGNQKLSTLNEDDCCISEHIKKSAHSLSFKDQKPPCSMQKTKSISLLPVELTNFSLTPNPVKEGYPHPTCLDLDLLQTSCQIPIDSHKNSTNLKAYGNACLERTDDHQKESASFDQNEVKPQDGIASKELSFLKSDTQLSPSKKKYFSKMKTSAHDISSSSMHTITELSSHQPNEALELHSLQSNHELELPPHRSDHNLELSATTDHETNVKEKNMQTKTNTTNKIPGSSKAELKWNVDSAEIIQTDKIFCHVSALLNNDLAKLPQVNHFIQNELPRATGVKCVRSPDHMTINGSFLEVSKAWHILHQMKKVMPNNELIHINMEHQQDHDYDQSTKSLKVIWTEPNGKCHELSTENVSKGMYVAKKPKMASVSSQSTSKTNIPQKCSQISKEGKPTEWNHMKDSDLSCSKGENNSLPDYTNNIVDNELPHCRRENHTLPDCDIPIIEKESPHLKGSESDFQNDTLKVNSDEISVHTESVFSVNDPSKNISFEVVLKDENRIECWTETTEVDNDDVNDVLAHQKILHGEQSQDTIQLNESKFEEQRASGLNLENCSDAGKEKLVMITGPFGDKQCILLTVDASEVKGEEIESAHTDRDTGLQNCQSENVDSVSDVKHHKSTSDVMDQINAYDLLNNKHDDFRLFQNGNQKNKSCGNEHTGNIDGNMEVMQSEYSDATTAVINIQTVKDVCNDQCVRNTTSVSTVYSEAESGNTSQLEVRNHNTSSEMDQTISASQVAQNCESFIEVAEYNAKSSEIAQDIQIVPEVTQHIPVAPEVLQSTQTSLNVGQHNASVLKVSSEIGQNVPVSEVNKIIPVSSEVGQTVPKSSEVGQTISTTLKVGQTVPRLLEVGQGIPSTEVIFKCSKCSAVFSEDARLKQHKCDNHRAERHLCGTCGKSFSEKRYLHAHLNRHFGMKKHTCSICGWKFFERHKLQLHLETHKSVDKRRLPYRCLICLHQFHNRATWSDHLNTHTGAKPFACSVCPARFAHRIGLKRHHLVHEKETRFNCSFCGKGFKLKTKLQEHLTVHTGKGRHMCQICSKVFTASTSLKRHMYTAHDQTGGIFETETSLKQQVFLDDKEHDSSSSGKDTLFMCWRCGSMFQTIKDLEDHSSTLCHSQVKLEVVETSSGDPSYPAAMDTSLVIHQTEQPEECDNDAQLQSLLSSLQNAEGGNSAGLGADNSAGPGADKSTLDEVEQMKLAASTLADLYSYAQEIKKEKE